MEINKIIELIGGYKALSEILNVSKSAISNYKKRGSLPSYACLLYTSDAADE